MGEPTTLQLDSTILEQNLAALRKVDAALADLVAKPALTQELDPVPARNREGRTGLRTLRSGKTREWFGRSSVPFTRAGALLERFDMGQANVLLPGIGEGTEANLLTRRLGSHRAVFMWESDARSVRLALCLHNLADAIARERLVFLVCPIERLTDTLLAWLREHPGHCCPERIMMWPWQIPAELATCRIAVEKAYQAIEHHRQQSMAALRSRWQSLPAPAGFEANPPRIGLLALHADDATWALTDALAAGARNLGWQACRLEVRGPGDVHPLARAQRLTGDDDRLPDWALLVNVTRSQIGDCLPTPVPAITWLGPRAAPVLDSLKSQPPGLFAVTHEHLASQAAAAGIDKNRLIVCPPPCLAPLDAEPGPTSADRPIDVVLLADVSPLDAESTGLRLPALAKVWDKAIEMIRAQAGSFTGDQAEDLVQRVERKLDSPIEDACLRHEIVSHLASHAGAIVVAQEIAQALIDSKVRVRIHGSGWPDGSDHRYGPPAATMARQLEILRSAKILIHADVTGLAPETALLAAGCGTVVLARAHPRDRAAGGLQTLLAPDHEILVFRRVNEMLTILRELLASDARRQELALTAYRRCGADHAPIARLEALRTAASSFPGPSKG